MEDVSTEDLEEFVFMVSEEWYKHTQQMRTYKQVRDSRETRKSMRRLRPTLIEKQRYKLMDLQSIADTHKGSTASDQQWPSLYYEYTVSGLLKRCGQNWIHTSNNNTWRQYRGSPQMDFRNWKIHQMIAITQDRRA